MTINNNNSFKETFELMEFLNGELLGDGHLNPILYNNKITSIRYQHGSSHRDYLIWLSFILYSFGLQQSGIIRSRVHNIPTSKHQCIDYHYSTKCYRQLLPYYSKWYNNRIKIIPKDLELTPITLRQFYIGDGSISNDNLFLSTCNFSIEDIERLKILLLNKGIYSERTKHKRLYISRYSLHDFFKYIGPCPEEIKDIYCYKWNVSDKWK